MENQKSKAQRLLNAEHLRTLFRYDQKSKTLLRTTAKNGNRARVLKPAGTIVESKSGLFCQIGVDGKIYPAEIIAFSLHTGRVPVAVRCRNGNRLDLSPENLVEVAIRERLSSPKGWLLDKRTYDYISYVYHPKTRRRLNLAVMGYREEAEALAYLAGLYIDKLKASAGFDGATEERIEHMIRREAAKYEADPCKFANDVCAKNQELPRYPMTRDDFLKL